MEPYNFRESDKRWQNWWEENGTYHVTEDSSRPKYYVLDMFPYPSGAGIHVGHPRGYVASDVFARQKRMSGYNVLHPMGFDSFGLPAEQYAIKTGNHPGPYTDELVESYRKQLKMIGFSYDWDREVETHNPQYYKWTQWIFLKLYDHYYDTAADKALPMSDLIKHFETTGNADVSAHTTQTQQFTAGEWKSYSELEQQSVLMNYRIAYEGFSEVNWCPEMGTVLANDEVVTVNGKMVSERGEYPVERKQMRQWFMRITAYADRLIDGLDGLDWNENIKTIQKNWIGKSVGSEIAFTLGVRQTESVVLLQDLQNSATATPSHQTGFDPFGATTGTVSSKSITVFTTRADTLFGVTYVVIAPEHEIVQSLLQYVENKSEVEDYITWTASRGEDDRMADREKTGVPLNGITAINPANGQSVPVWIADYVLANYGTGCVMAVPAHDERDMEFAIKYSLPVKNVIIPKSYGSYGTDINSGDIITLEEAEDIYNKILCGEICFVKYGILQNSGEFNGVGSQTAKEKITEFVGGKIVTKYKMRDAIFARQRYWGEPIPLRTNSEGVISKMDESVLPLVLPQIDSFEPTGTGLSPLSRDDAWVKSGIETNTMPGWAGSSWYWFRYMDPHNDTELASPEAIHYWRNVDMYVGGSEHATGHLLYSRFWHKFLYDIGVTTDSEPFLAMRNQGLILASDGRKMSKRWGNTVTPDEMIERFGSDAFRLYECFIGPFDASQPWIIDGMVGCARFLERVWKLQPKVSSVEPTSDAKAISQLHKTIKKVSSDIADFKFNTSVSALMELSNAFATCDTIALDDYIALCKLLAPFAPHMTEQLYHTLQPEVGDNSIHHSDWPIYNPELLSDDMMTIAIQVNGKMRGTFEIATSSTESEVLEKAKEQEGYQKWTTGETIKKQIYIPGRLVSVIV